MSAQFEKIELGALFCLVSFLSKHHESMLQNLTFFEIISLYNESCLSTKSILYLKRKKDIRAI